MSGSRSQLVCHKLSQKKKMDDQGYSHRYSHQQHHTEERNGIPVASIVSSKVENLNAPSTKSNKQRSKSRVKMASEPDLQPTVKMDYSNIHKENDYLDDDLELHLGHLNRDQQRLLAEQGGQVDEIRRQVEAITKLQEAVNSRQPGESSAVIVSNSRVTRYGRQGTNEEKQSKEIDFRELANATRSQMRIDAERDKFSSKNLFNVRRSKTSTGFESTRKFFHPSSMQTPSDHDYDKTDSGDGAKNEFGSAKQKRNNRSKGYLKGTLSSQHGLRPMTAGTGYQREEKQDDILPPRAQSAVLRSRSRRELELLSRVVPKEDEIELTFDQQANWEAISESRRRRRLQQLRLEEEELQSKVQSFLSDLEGFNKKPAPLRKASMMKRTSKAL